MHMYTCFFVAHQDRDETEQERLHLRINAEIEENPATCSESSEVEEEDGEGMPLSIRKSGFGITNPGSCVRARHSYIYVCMLKVCLKRSLSP